MTVKEFVEKYVKATEIEKAKLFKEIEIKTYVPYAEKVVHSEAVLSKTAKRVNGVLQNNSSLRYLAFVTSILKLYTSLELNSSVPHEDYDLLKECGAIDIIMDKIGDDVREFTTIFNMTWEDMVQNENNWKTFIASQLSSFVNNVEKNMQNEEIRKLMTSLNIFQ